MKRVLLAVFCVTLLSVAVWGETWNLDAAHSKLRFTAEARFLSADGMFRKFEVKADLNEQQLEKSQIEMTIDVNSIDTAVVRRDNHLKSADFFDAANFPTATIKVKGIRKLSDQEYEADAEVTIRGVAKQMKLPARVLLLEGGRLRFRGTIPLNRMEFGIKYNGNTNKIDDIVNVTYELNLVKPRPPAPPKQ